MILLDTNIVSEAMKPKSNPCVQAWLNQQVAETLYLSTITLAELLFGVASLPLGRRKDRLAKLLNDLIQLFENRVLPFDVEAAQHFAKLATLAKSIGRGFPTPDGYIAAIAASRNFTVASRDTSPFEAAGVPTLNPF